MFHFDIDKNYFYRALDRFAQFFIEPLMTKGSVDREVKAVDSGKCNWLLYYNTQLIGVAKYYVLLCSVAYILFEICPLLSVCF